jgi:hypothetical protein
VARSSGRTRADERRCQRLGQGRRLSGRLASRRRAAPSGSGQDAWGKKIITEKPDEEELIDFGRLYKAEDRSALKGGVDMIGATIIRSRSRLTAAPRAERAVIGDQTGTGESVRV